MRQVRSSGVRFESEFGLTGGEDTLFTRQLRRGGYRLVWCDESVVEDLIPSARLTRAWVLRRAWSHGNTTSLIDIHLSQGAADVMRARVSWGAGGLARIAAGCARVLLGHFRRSLRDRSKGSRVMCRGAGMLAGAVGYSYQEYSRPLGDGRHSMPARIRHRVRRSAGHTAPGAVGE